MIPLFLSYRKHAAGSFSAYCSIKKAFSSQIKRRKGFIPWYHSYSSALCVPDSSCSPLPHRTDALIHSITGIPAPAYRSTSWLINSGQTVESQSVGSAEGLRDQFRIYAAASHLPAVLCERYVPTTSLLRLCNILIYYMKYLKISQEENCHVL